MNGHPYPSAKVLLAAIAKHHLVSPPGFYPSYSNTGLGVLGLALAAASSAASGEPSVLPYADVMKRDVFDPMGLNGSHFLATDANRHLIVVPSVEPDLAVRGYRLHQDYLMLTQEQDHDFLDAMNPAGGQFSSLADVMTLAQTILDPSHPKSQISSYARDKWLQPAHVFAEDDWTEIGLVWEILKAADSNGRLRKIYWKRESHTCPGFHVLDPYRRLPASGQCGRIPHCAIAVHPGTSYGVVVLMAGPYPDTAKLVYDTFALLQPAIDRALVDAVDALYVGSWTAETANVSAPTSARIAIERGTLYMEALVLLGADALKAFGAESRLAMRATGFRDEFRYVLVPGSRRSCGVDGFPFSQARHGDRGVQRREAHGLLSVLERAGHVGRPRRRGDQRAVLHRGWGRATPPYPVPLVGVEENVNEHCSRCLFEVWYATSSGM